MKVITNRHIIQDDYSNGNGFLEKLKGLGGKAKGFGEKVGIGATGGGFLGKAQGLLGGLGGQQQQQQQAPPPPPPPPPPPKGMSKGLKIGLIVGGSVLVLAIIGVVIYKSRNK